MNIEQFCCPNCQSNLEQLNLKQYQLFSCGQCQYDYPLFSGLIFFNEGQPDRLALLDRCKQIEAKIEDRKGYENYVEHKMHRDANEIYAAFQPFNESSRTVYPFLQQIKNQLASDDIVLDCWSRTGWSALLLAQIFSKQQVLAFWDGDNSVLGYGGYAYWFHPQRKPTNLTIAFLSPEQPIPLKNDTVSFIHGHDIAHRRPLPEYWQECLRVGTAKCSMLFPHVHLANSEPEPYFKRGGNLRHGTIYKNHLEQLVIDDERLCYVLSEPEIFQQLADLSLSDASAGFDYNGFLAILPPFFRHNNLSENWRFGTSDDSERVICNPLLKVNPFDGNIYRNDHGLQQQFEYLMERHPVYMDKLSKIIGTQLSSNELSILANLSRSTVSESRKQWRGQHEDWFKIINRLDQLELITWIPTSMLAFELQQFHSNRHLIFETELCLALTQALKISPQAVMGTIEGETITLEEWVSLINNWHNYLQQNTSITSLSLNCKDLTTLAVAIAALLLGIAIDNASNDNGLISFFNNAKLPVMTTEANSDEYWRWVELFDCETNLLEKFIIGQISNNPDWPNWVLAVKQQ